MQGNRLEIAQKRRNAICTLDECNPDADNYFVHFFWVWILVTGVWQVLRYSLIICDLAMMFAVKCSWLVAFAIAGAAWFHIGWWVACLVLLANFTFEWFIWFYMPSRWLLRYEVNVQAFRYVDQMRKQLPTDPA